MRMSSNFFMLHPARQFFIIISCSELFMLNFKRVLLKKGTCHILIVLTLDGNMKKSFYEGGLLLTEELINEILESIGLEKIESEKD